MWLGYKNFDHYFNLDEMNEFFEEVKELLPLVQKQENLEYYNIPASFDIETSSDVIDDKKVACMYIWQFGINGSVIIGRTWDEFINFYNILLSQLDISMQRRLIVYVHNLGYEFQFIRKLLDWKNVFAIKERRPIYALTKEGIEFRCSLLLSNYALAYVGANLLVNYPVKKMVGDLDYSKNRTPITPLTEREIGYCINDVRVVMAYIQEKIEQDGDITKIPLTNTGYVRNYCRDYCFTGGLSSEAEKKKRLIEYRTLMKQLTIKSEREYRDLKAAFSGGFTHAGSIHAAEILQNVGSGDLTSSYPFTMVGQLFPMSEGVYVGDVNDPDRLQYFIDNFCCLFTATFRGLYSTLLYESYISVSHCLSLDKHYVANNGRLVDAESCSVTITELDWDIISRVYDWEDVKITGMRIYAKGYLPKNLIMSILQLYKNKTTLKGVEDKEIEYMVSKNMINAAYGMAVTSIVRDQHVYDDEWEKVDADTTSQLGKYNNSFTRFLFYAWGVWVTAHARHNLWEAIFEFGEDYVYADTDSIKGLNFENHLDFFTDYNLRVREQLLKMCTYYKIPFSMCMPKTKKGVSKLIGVWDMEEPYEYFKTLGAKRYMYVHKSGEINMTVSGVNKKYAVPYMLYKYGGKKYNNDYWLSKFQLAYSPDPSKVEESKKAMEEVIAEYKSGKLSYYLPLEMFRPSLEIPPGFTGKQSVTYIDNPQSFCMIDYLGIPYICTEQSSVHMTPAGYYFSVTDNYLKFIKGVKETII